MIGKKCPFTGVNICRFLLSLVAGSAFVFGFDFVIHGNLLMPTYNDTPELWRPVDEMQKQFPWMLTHQIMLTLITLFIYTRNYEGKGIGEGVRFGMMIGLLMGILSSAAYAWMPISEMLAFAWLSVGFFKGLGLGVIYSLLYSDGDCSKGVCSKTEEETNE